MSHHDDHEHHHHHHNHPHHNDHDIPSQLTLAEKAIKMLEHWIRHNQDHAKTYLEWSDKLKDLNLTEASALIDEAASMSAKINEKFQKAADLIRKL